MKTARGLTRIDVLVVFGCVIFLLFGLGALGRSGRGQAKRAVCMSNSRQWALAIKNYAADNDDYYPLRFWPPFIPATPHQPYSWPHQYYKERYVDLLSVFINPYVGEQKYTWCPAVPDSPDPLVQHPHDTYDRQLELSAYPHIIGDYGLYVGYPPPPNELKRGVYIPTGTSGFLTWEFFYPPARSQCAIPSMMTTGDIVYGRGLEDDGGMWKYNHPYSGSELELVEDPPKGMNGAFADLSVKWVPWRNMARMFTTTHRGYSYYWADPSK